jgi:hypothetical protein
MAMTDFSALETHCREKDHAMHNERACAMVSKGSEEHKKIQDDKSSLDKSVSYENLEFSIGLWHAGCF